ncbi:MAG: hypothetical protein AB7G87_10570 [Clostridia bacterium]
MYWSRVKTILIILFLCINIFLLISMMVSVNQTITISSDALEDTVEVLKRNGIEIDKNIIPTKMSHMPSLKMENPVRHPVALAEMMIGAGFEQEIEGSEYKFVLNDKALIVRGCEFTYSDKASDMDMKALNQTNAEEYVRKILLESFKFDLQYAAPGIVKKVQDGRFTVMFQQEYAKKRIFSNYIIVDISAKGEIDIKGYWLIPKGFTSEKIPVRHVTSILIDFIKNSDRPQDQTVTVTGIALGYHRVDMNDVYVKETMAAPAWRITTDDGNVYYYDAATGKYVPM